MQFAEFERHLEHLNQFSIEHTVVRPNSTIVEEPTWCLITATFSPILGNSVSDGPEPAKECFVLFEKFYVTVLLSNIMRNYSRNSNKRRQPLMYAYLDYPFSRRRKRSQKITDPLPNTSYNQERLDCVGTSPHIHAIAVFPPSLVPALLEKTLILKMRFSRLSVACNSLDICMLNTLDDIRKAMQYASKLRQWRLPELGELDRYVCLPKSSNEPGYQKTDWEKKVERSLVMDRRFKKRHVQGVLASLRD